MQVPKAYLKKILLLIGDFCEHNFGDYRYRKR
jgi:hypothetical protein